MRAGDRRNLGDDLARIVVDRLFAAAYPPKKKPRRKKAKLRAGDRRTPSEMPYDAHTVACQRQAEEDAIQGEEPVCICMDKALAEDRRGLTGEQKP